MRVLFLASTFPPTIGGAETYALNLTRALAERGHEIEVVTDTVQGCASSENVAANLRVLRLHAYRNLLSAPDRIFWEEMTFGLHQELFTIVNRFQPDIVMSNSLDLCVNAKLTSITANIPWVATFHEQAPERDPLGQSVLQLCYGILSPDAVVAGSRFYLERALRFAPEGKCHLIYHGIDTRLYRPLNTSAEVRATYGFSSDSIVLVSLGRFKERKGFLDLIEALPMVVGAGRSVSLVIAGSLNSASTEYYGRMRRLVEHLNLVECVRFEERLGPDRVPWLLSGSDIVVQASHEEGLGLALIEAMACARPVVATRIPAHLEVISNAGEAILVAPRAPHELAEAIVSLVGNDAARTRLGGNARSRIANHFSIEAMVSTTIRLMETVINGRIAHAR